MKFVVFALLFACLSFVAVAQNSVDIYTIDSFDVYSDTLIVVTSASTTFPASDFSSVQDASIFTGERDSLLTVTTAPTGMVFSASVDQGEYSSSAPPSGTAFSLLQYDGTDDSSNLNPSGGSNSPNRDFTANGATALHLVITSDQSTTVEVFVYSGSANNYCSFTFNVPGGSQTSNYIAQYTAFARTGSGCDFTNVQAVEILTDLPPNVDIFVESFATYGTIASTPSATPSPSRAAVSPSNTPAPSKAPCECVCKAFHCVLEYDPSGVNTFYYETSDLNPNNSGRTSGTSNNSSSDASTLSVAFALIALVALLL